MELKEILTLIQIFATAAVGFAALYISHQQYKANRTKILFELFNERYTVYNSLFNLVFSSLKEAESIPNSVWSDYHKASAKAPFLFNQSIVQYMYEVRKAVDHTVIYETKRSLDPKYDQMEYLSCQLDEMVEKFKPFLKINIQESKDMGLSCIFNGGAVFLGNVKNKLTSLSFFTKFLSKFRQ